MSNTAKVTLLAILTFIIGLSLGFLGAKSYPFRKAIPGNLIDTSNQSKLFNSQTATLQGKILKVSGDTLTVQNKNGATGDIQVSDKVVISSLGVGPSQASPSTDLKAVRLNEDVFISLQLVDGTYKAVLIQYLPHIIPLRTNAASSSSVKSTK